MDSECTAALRDECTAFQAICSVSRDAFVAVGLEHMQALLLQENKAPTANVVLNNM